MNLLRANPSLFTRLIRFPAGISLVDNASFPLLATVFSPVTAVVGPVGAYVLLFRVSFFVSVLSCFLVLRRVSRRTISSSLGGAVYAFSPFMTHQAASHIFLVFAPLPALMLLLIYGQVTRTSGFGPWRAGILLGVLAVTQFLIDSETLVSTTLLAGCVLGIIGSARLVRRQSVRDPGIRIAKTLSATLVVAAPLLAYPAWFSLAGPQHVIGPTQPTSGSGGTDLLASLFPADDQLLSWIVPFWRIRPQVFLGHSPYVGVPLVLFLVPVVVAKRKEAAVQAAAFLGLVAWVLELGDHLQLGTIATKVPLPFDVVARFPVLQDLIPARMGLFVGLSMAMLLAGAVDLLIGLAKAQRQRLACAIGALIVVSIAGLMPVRTYGAAPTGGASTFGSTVGRSIPPDSVVLAYPLPAFPDDRAMIWQAVDEMRFSLLGGYGIRPGLRGRTVRSPFLNQPTVVPQTFIDLAAGRPVDAFTFSFTSKLPSFIRAAHVGAILVDGRAARAAEIVRVISSTIGRPIRLSGFDLWILRRSEPRSSTGRPVTRRAGGGLPAVRAPGR